MDLLPICTREEIQEIDRVSRAGDIHKGFEFMQEAARSLLDIVIQDSVNFSPVTYFVFSGKGNNGGDGNLLASYLIDQGYTVIVFIFAKADELKNEAALAYEELQKRDSKNIYHRFIENESDLFYCTQALDQNPGINYIIDAMLGSSSQTAPRGILKPAIQGIREAIKRNKSKTRVIAVDNPSGVDVNTAEVFEPAMAADITVSLGFPKLACYFYPAKAFFSNTIVKSLNYNPELSRKILSNKIFYPSHSFFRKSIPQRLINGSKFDHGVVLNFSSSPGMSGAGFLSSYAAYKSGIGLVKLISDHESCSIIASKLSEATYHSYHKETESLKLAKELLASKYNAVCVGPGLGKGKDELIRFLIRESKAPIILDADGINSFAANPQALSDHQAELLLTPHQGEYLRLFPEDFTKESKPLEIINAIKKRAQEFKITILLKGNPTLIVDSHGHVFIIPFGNSALATAGSGDVLSGIIAALAAQLELRASNKNAEISILTQAAILGAYIHARAGELASIDLSEYSVMASDIANYIPLAIKELLNQQINL